MNKELYVSSTPHETRLALAEDGEIAEVYYEREKEYSLAGAIYKGRVTRVLPGMQSAFVDVGLERDAFLYVSDFFEDSEEYDRVVSEAENAVARLDRPAPGVASGATAATATAETVAESSGSGAANLENAAAAAGATDAAGDESGEAGPAPIIVPQQAARSQGDDDDRRRRGPRHRRGGRGHRSGFPESKFARPDGGGETARERAAPRAEGTEAPAPRSAEMPAVSGGYTPMILPGESLAKYRNQPAPSRVAAPPPQAPEPTESRALEPSEQPEPTAARSHASEPIELPRVEFEREPIRTETLRHQVEPASFDVDVQLVDSIESDDERGEAAEDFDATNGDEMDSESADEEAAEAAAESGNAEDDAAELSPEGENDAAAVSGRSEPARLQAPASAGQEGQRGGRRHRRRRGGRQQREARNPAEGAAVPAQGASAPAAAPARAAAGGPRTITELLRAGQEILVQISKEPIGKKGARITSHLALPGRFLVYMPTVSHIGVSRKIGSDEERARLKRFILEQSKDLPGGFIVRTAAADATDEELANDVRLLGGLWADIRQEFEASRSPALLHHDLDLVERTLRDQLNDEFTHIWVDTDEMFQRVVKFVSYFKPELTSRVRLYTRDQPLFEHFGVQEEIDKALKSKVWLKSGGYIVLNQTEALVAIDVNTGKYVGRSNRLEDTIVKTNVDAIKEIVRQIRLRDLGGIIVIDFIDMDERRNRQRVMQALEEAMRADRAPSKVLSFNDFGLVALTRKRVKQSLERTLGCACPYCEGVGLVKSPVTVCNEIYIEARKVAPTIERDDLVLRVNPEVARLLKGNGAARLRELETQTGKAVSVRSDPAVHQQQFEIY